MQIVWNQEVVEQLRKTQTLFQLETFDVNGTAITTYCVVPAEKLVPELANLPELTQLHMNFLEALDQKDLESCESLSSQLTGHFGGELDTFYKEIITRLKNA